MVKNVGSIVIFMVNNTYYGLDIRDVREIITMQPLTQIPNSKKYIKGIINFRGNVLTLIDMISLFDFERQNEINKEEKIIILDRNKVGIVVDDVIEIVELDEKGKRDLELTGFGKYIDCLFEHNDKIISIINLESLLDRDSESYLFNK